MAASDRQCLLLDRTRPVLVRPSGDVQIGWNPESTLLITPPESCTAEVLARLLRSLDGSRTIDEVVRHGERDGITTTALMALLSQLRDAGALTAVVSATVRKPPDVALAGQGPIADVLLRALPDLGVIVTQFTTPNQQRTQQRVARLRPLLVLITDTSLASPVFSDFLTRERLPSLAVRVRDGRGLVGPLVLPGLTSCLRCADLYRTDRDPEWPHLAAQLVGSVPHAPPAAVYAAAAYTLSQIHTILAATRQSREGAVPPHSPKPPQTLGTTVEFDASDFSIVPREWPRHPLCACWGQAPDSSQPAA